MPLGSADSNGEGAYHDDVTDYSNDEPTSDDSASASAHTVSIASEWLANS
jgi:hypothetical protein